MNDIARKIEVRFKSLFNEEPFRVRSPGRINLIGEHTDYNEGFVLPAAIDKAIYFAISARTDGDCMVHAYDLNDSFPFSIHNLTRSPKRWPNYLMGVVDQFLKSGYTIEGFNCVFGGDIPVGAGLSSSAAIETGLAFALNEIFQLGILPLQLVKMAQKAENDFVGVQCGIMDQLVNLFGKKDSVLKLDCRTLAFEYAPFSLDDVQIVLCDTRISRELAISEYNLRHSQCQAGVSLLRKHHSEISSLRDVNLHQLEACRNEFDPVIYKRCHYIIQENSRVLSAFEDLKNGNFESFGKHMYQSHQGLRDEYEVSCKELDILVETASQIEGVLGARMMGAGFGGCTINLVRRDCLKHFFQTMEKTFREKLSDQPKFYEVNIESGTGQIN